MEEKQIPPEEWKISPDLIFGGYNEKKLDKTTAIYILKELFWQDRTWSRIEYRKECIMYITKISNKNKTLRSFLEEIFITEYWYHIRLKALYFIAQYYPEFAYSLFNCILGEELFLGFLNYILHKASYKEIRFLTKIIKDPLIILYIYLREKERNFKINIQKRKLTTYGDTLKIGSFKEFKRSKMLIQFSEKEILNQPIKSFVWKKRTEEGSIFEFDPIKRFPVLVLYQEEKEHFLNNYCISLSSLENLIKSIKRVFKLKKLMYFKIVKTTIVYLILKIEEIELYFKYQLMNYMIEV